MRSRPGARRRFAIEASSVSFMPPHAPSCPLMPKDATALRGVAFGPFSGLGSKQ